MTRTGLTPLRVLRVRDEPEVVIVLRFSALGDVLLTSPAIAALRAAWPRTRIIYAVKERFTHLVANSPHVSEVVGLREGEGPWSYARRLQTAAGAAQSVAVLDLHGKIRSKLLRACLPPSWPRVVWHKRDLLETLPVKLGLKPHRASMLFADRYHAAVEQLVGRTLPRGELRAFLGADDAARARELLGRAGIDLARPLLGMSPGANWETKRWPAEQYAQLARRALDAGMQVVIQGSDLERELVQRVVRAAGEGKHTDGRVLRAIDLAGQLDLALLGGVVSLCTAFVANDSGPMHLSRALGIPTLALFGSTDPRMFSWTGHRVLFKSELACAPCSFFGRRRCPRGHFRCMRELSVDEAWSALQELLQGGAPAPLSA